MTSEKLDLMFAGTADEQADHESLDEVMAQLEQQIEEIQVNPWDEDHPSIRAAEERDAQHGWEKDQ